MSFMPAWTTQQKSILNINEKQDSISMLIVKASLREKKKKVSAVNMWRTGTCALLTVQLLRKIPSSSHLAPKAKDRIIQQCQSECKRSFKREISMFREESLQSVQRMDEWINNMFSPYTIEQDSAIKEEVLKDAIIWMNLGDTRKKKPITRNPNVKCCNNSNHM